METKLLIERLKDPRREADVVALRFALYDKLYKSFVPVQKIAAIIGVTRGTVYHGIYHHRDLMESGDNRARWAQEEMGKHHIYLKPKFEAVNDCYMRLTGNMMVIDNENY